LSRYSQVGIVAATALVASACAHGPRAAAPAAPGAPSQTAAQPDPTSRTIAEADAHLARGLSEMHEGHLIQAREAFDQAIDLYLSYPGGAYANPRVAEAYRRTLETIHLRDLEALAAGDGFTEAEPEPAAIDAVGGIAVEAEPATEETRRTAEEVVRTEHNDLPLQLNDRVLSCIALYEGRLRDWFGAALARGGRYLPYIRKVFAEEGIPQDLAYTALVESAFKPSALSRAKARGVWQFIPETGRRYGLSQDWWIDERGDPEKATRAAAKYLKELYGMFGDWNLALAAYNAGENKIARGLARYGLSDFWSLAETSAIRRETKNYVPMIQAAIVVAKAPEQYGFSVEAEPALAYDAVPVQGAFDLRTIAECAGATLEDVRMLNPSLRRLATPAGRTFQMKVPTGSGDKLKTCLAELPAERRVSFRTHVVARGQTLAAIARRYGTRAEDIAQANNLSGARTPRQAPGTPLIIPNTPGRAAKIATAARAASASTAAPAPVAEKPATAGGARVSYRIKPGDTLASIADQYGVTVRAIQSWNRLRSTRIAAGAVLTLYPKRQ
jgi:membrane-bound lytic murein transglycosylase D